MTPLEILEFMSDGKQRMPDECYKHFGLSGKYDQRAARLDNTCLDLVLQERLCEPNGPFRELAITPSGKDYLIALRRESERAARMQAETDKQQQAEAARPKQRAMF